MRLLFFAWVREGVGEGERRFDLPEDCTTVGDVADWLSRDYPLFADRSRLRVAVDAAIADWDMPVAGAKEIAFFPPVTGG